MENIVYQLFLVLCRPNELNFTQLIVVTFTTVRPVARISQLGGCKNHEVGAHFLNTILNVRSNRHEKSLATCKLYSHLPRPRKLYIHERRTGWAPSFAYL